jgi:hypothetical protein
METNGQLYGVLNKAWKSTCRVVLGDEVGELKDFEAWLNEGYPEVQMKKSHVSGKGVMLWENRYCDKARFVSEEEVVERKVDPLTINEIKDIDSIINAVSEKWEYAGNRIQGNSSFVENSDIIIDSQYVADSTNILNSQYVHSTFMIRRGSKYIFGSGGFGEGEFVVRSVDCYNIKRVFGSYFAVDSSDIFMSFNCSGCMENMFTFSQKNKRHCIGNMELPKDKYSKIKESLLAEIRDELKAKKRFPSLAELVRPGKPKAGKPDAGEGTEQLDIRPIEKAFASTYKVILKKEPRGGMDDYAGWLLSNVPKMLELETVFGTTTYLPDDPAFRFFAKTPKERIVTFFEAMELGKLKMDEKDVQSIETIKEGLAKIAFFTMELVSGMSKNAIKSPVVYNSSNLYRMYDGTYSEYAGVGLFSLNSKYVFGCYRIMESQFCLKCYNSIGMARCLEVNTSSKCQDALYCCNCEGLSDAMFCFNAKGKRHAIGNAELEPGKYKAIKDSLIEQIADKLEKDRSFKWNIYNIGCAK